MVEENKTEINNAIVDGEIHYHVEKKLMKKLLKMAKRITDDSDQNGYIINHGATGCLSGDTIVKISRLKGTRDYTLEGLYKRFNGLQINKNRKKFDKSIPAYIRSFNGEEIRLHKIRAVMFSGIKKVYRLTLDNGLTIKGTADHKIMTNKGWVQLCNLINDHEVMCDSINAEPLNRKRIKLRDIGLCVGGNHPYNTRPNHQIEVHRLIYEARLNGLEFMDSLDILLNEPERCKNLKFIDPAVQIIHHKDGCHYNNSIDNLELLPREQHCLKHNNYTNFSKGIPKFSKVMGIEFIGEEGTYDIECEEPHHNFVANGIVVHNSGKTNTACVEAHVIKTLTGRDIHLFFRLDELIQFAKSSNNKIIIWDEPAFTSLSNDASARLNKDLLRLINTSRLKRHLIIINFTKFWRFNVDLVTETAQFMLHMNDKEFKKGRFLYLPADNLEKLWEDYRKFNKKNYLKYKKFGGSMPFIYKKWFKQMDITVDGKPHATYQDYLDLRDLSVSKIGEQDKKKDKNWVKLVELRQKVVKALEIMNINKTDFANSLGVNSGRLREWKKLDPNTPISLEN